MSKSVGSVYMDLELNSSKFDKGIKTKSNDAQNIFASSMAKIGTYIAGAFAVKTVVDFGSKAVEQASKMQSAWTGLNSIVSGSGKSFATAQKFITDYTKDGLVSVEEAVTSYKNLLSRGYNTSQIENTMKALKDSASFGRQSSYGLGEAVKSATEGLKNENSILVDNAGVTKNVAKMWEDWARAHNTTTSAMTQAQKIEAEYNGILAETKFQTGDAAVYTKTFGGRVQTLNMAFTNLKVAVGQVVAPLVGAFIPIINACLVTITNFFKGISSLLKVFGISFPDVVSKTNNSINKIGSSAVKTAGDIASTGKSAQKAAKEIHKAFAGVDEINVLNTKQISSSDDSTGGSGGISAPSTEIGISEASDGNISSAIDGTISKIMKYIEPLKNISFDNLINAFNNLKTAVSPIIDTLGKGLEWIYFNILVPLAKWTIGNALPAFFNLFAGALRVANPLIESFGRIFQPIWDNLLKPLTNFTADLFIKTINRIASALDKIGKWMDKNKNTVDLMTDSVVAFFAAWEITKLMGFIQMSGGLVFLLKSLAAALWAVTGAKVADKLQTMYLTALYAKDFIVSIVSTTVNLIKQGVAWLLINGYMAAYNIVAGIGTAATWAFNAAMAVLTSPITLVILAIVGLIAIIVLLVKHWDNVKNFAISCWDEIKSVWNTVAEWFNQSVVQPISNFFKGMWGGLKNGASNAWDGIKSVFSTVASFFGNTFSNAWEAVKNVFSAGGKIFDGIKDGIVNAFKIIVNSIIRGINNIVSIPFKGINGALNKLKNINILGGKPFNFLPTISTPQIPMLAQGGYLEANNPRLAIVGDNKREGEIVAPESKIYEQTYKAVKDAMNDKNSNIDLNIYVRYEDGKTIIKKINKAQLEAGEVLLEV